MSSLESTDDEEAAETNDGTDEGATVTVTAGDQELAVSLPADASKSEAAAIATAIGAHVTDRHRAAAAASDSEPEYANEWVLEGRVSRFGKRRRPDRVEKGDEWKAAGRSFYR